MPLGALKAAASKKTTPAEDAEEHQSDNDEDVDEEEEEGEEEEEEEQDEEEDEEDEEEEDSDDEPVAKKKAKAKGVSEKKKPAAKKAPAKKTNEKKTPTKKAKAPAKAKKSPVVKAKKMSNQTPTPSSQMYNQTEKGKLVQSVLCRWWYAMEWPEKSTIIDAPANYDAMDAFPGVYICTKGDDVGAIFDNRNKKTCPNFTNLINKPVSELKVLLEKAVSVQKAHLVKGKEKGGDTDKALDALLKWANKLNDAKTEKEAKSFAKESGLDVCQ